MGFMDRSAQRAVGIKEDYLRPPTVPVPKWEYAIIQYPNGSVLDVVQDQINLMGSYGWELTTRHDHGVGVTRMSDSYLVLFFKRLTL